jgi:hypothetical protein
VLALLSRFIFNHGERLTYKDIGHGLQCRSITLGNPADLAGGTCT